MDEPHSIIVSRIEFVAKGKHARPLPVVVWDKDRFSWRPQLFMDDRSWCTSYLIDTLLETDELGPGDTGLVSGVLLTPGMFPALKVGDRFSLSEGRQIVATGQVLEIRPGAQP